MTLILFWSAVALILYSFVLFPALIFAYGLFWRRPFQSAEITPMVSIIIAARNEAANIGARLENILALDYPREKLEVLIASDGSTDSTNAIVESYGLHGIRLLALPRQGKIPALNAAVAASTGEILVFSDANSIYTQNSLRALVRPFTDPRVGGVAGNQKYLKQRGSGVADDGEHSYWNFDRLLKRFQSRAGNVISATGSIYAIRRSLFQPIPLGVTDDFVASTRVIAQGYRLVFAADAISYEPVSSSGSLEFKRKVRVTTQGLRAVYVMRELLNPFRYGFYSVQIFSHKVLRRMVVFPLLILMVTGPLLWNYGLFYQGAALAQAAFYACAILALLLQGTRLGRIKLFTIPFYFCMVYAASLVATANILRGQRIVLWEPQRQDGGSKPVAGKVSLPVPPERSSS